jgi:enoyl-CoA hydratase/carnithine racemase
MTGETGKDWDDGDIRLNHDGKVAVLTLARGSAMNAINDSIRRGIVRACAEVAGDPDVGALLLRADGERAFCVGADIKEDKAPLSQVEGRMLPPDRHYTAALAGLAKPIVAAIHGFCLGGGLEIALACDIRVAAKGASFALPEIDLALIPGAGGTQRLTRLIGAARALDMMMTAERIPADRALAYGLVTRLCDTREALDETALALAHSLAAKAPVAMTYLKEAVLAGAEESLSAGLVRERDLFTLLQATQDRAEAADAFKSKRRPVFVGR